MRYLLILFLLVGCTSVGQYRSSPELFKAAEASCKTVPELDGQRNMCMYAYMYKECMGGLDLKICGKLDK